MTFGHWNTKFYQIQHFGDGSAPSVIYLCDLMRCFHDNSTDVTRNAIEIHDRCQELDVLTSLVVLCAHILIIFLH